MKTIKLRAWDSEFMEYIDDLYWFEERGVHEIVNGRAEQMAGTKHSALIIMQYIGLKDKNGTEVYEGDIVRCQQGCPHEVIWLQEYAGTYVGGMPAWYLSGLKEGYAWSGDEEVIGNIYEHPHLLKEDA